MNDPILKAGTFEVRVGGVDFVMRRRSTMLMVKARGLMKTLGIVGGAQAVEDGQVEAAGVTVEEGADLVEAVLRAALVSPQVAPPGEPSSPPSEYSFDDLAPFADGLFRAFMTSGLNVEPFLKSCEDQKEPASQES